MPSGQRVACLGEAAPTAAAAAIIAVAWQQQQQQQEQQEDKSDPRLNSKRLPNGLSLSGMKAHRPGPSQSPDQGWLPPSKTGDRSKCRQVSRRPQRLSRVWRCGNRHTHGQHADQDRSCLPVEKGQDGGIEPGAPCNRIRCRGGRTTPRTKPRLQYVLADVPPGHWWVTAGRNSMPLRSRQEPRRRQHPDRRCAPCLPFGPEWRRKAPPALLAGPPSSVRRSAPSPPRVSGRPANKRTTDVGDPPILCIIAAPLVCRRALGQLQRKLREAVTGNRVNVRAKCLDGFRTEDGLLVALTVFACSVELWHTVTKWTFSFKLTLFTFCFTLCITPHILFFTTHGAIWSPHPIIYTGCSLREPYSEAA